MVWLAELGSHTGYASGVLGPLILIGIGLSMVIAPAINTGTFGVAPQDTGVASATSGRLIGRQALTGQALVHGYDTAFWWTAGIFAVGAVIGGALLRRGPLVQKGTPFQVHDEVPATQARPLP
jgi:hypothetical protein